MGILRDMKETWFHRFLFYLNYWADSIRYFYETVWETVKTINFGEVSLFYTPVNFDVLNKFIYQLGLLSEWKTSA